MRGKLIIGACGTAVAIVGVFFSVANADRYSSTSYIIDASTSNTFGGSGGSTSYKMTGSGGESIVGNGSGGSYKVGMGYVAQLDKSLTLAVQPSGLIGYWPLDEGAGAIIQDYSTGAYNGSLIAGPTRTTGKIGQAVQFNGGTSQWGNLGNPTAFQTTTFTVEAWENRLQHLRLKGLPS